MEDIAPAKTHTMYLVRKVADKLYLAEDGSLIVVLASSRWAGRCVPVRTVHKVYFIMMQLYYLHKSS